LPPFNLIITRDLSEIELLNAFETKLELITDKWELANDIDPAPAIPKTFKNPLLSQ